MTMSQTEAKLEVERLTNTIGAIVTGVDLSEDLPDSTMKEIESLLDEHSVLFFLDQDLDDVSQRRFGSWFGDLDVHPSGRNAQEMPEIFILKDYYQNVPWHADVTFQERPARASVLRAEVLPSVGGDTIWASTCFAYDELSSATQRFIDGLHAYHDSTPITTRDPHIDVVGTVHPVVIDHPRTGRRSIFVNPLFTTRIVELSEDESRDVLAMLYRYIQMPSHHVRWRWRPGAVAMWDNFATQHFVVHDYTEPRTMRRITIQGVRPTSAVAAASVSA